MKVSELLKDLRTEKTSGPDADIKGIAYDSRLVREGFIFVAVRGFNADGHDYIEDALSRGAAAVVVEDAVAAKIAEKHNTRTTIEVPDSRESLALISAAFYGHPSRKLSLTGITGTNGKTTTGFIAKNIIEAGGHNTGLLGTVCYMLGSRTCSAVNTTPESADLQRYLNEMVSRKIGYAAMEVSSHALALKRVEGCTFRVAAFTNFTQDHLDFHGSMEEYFESKKRLFDYLHPEGTAVLNQDDPVIGRLSGGLERNVITCGTDEGATVRAVNIQENMTRRSDRGYALPSGISFDVHTPWGEYSIDSCLLGRFNVHNILVAAGIGHALGFSADIIRKGIRNTKPVEGRFEHVDEGQDFLCVIDYAHTEDALRKLLTEAAYIAEGRVITVFGCGGDRDRSKRPGMGETASELSDLVVLTSDNPRSEEPSEIITDIVKGIKRKNYRIQPDRAEAILEAASAAKQGDVLVIAGKGHEDYQEIKGVKNHFSDKEEFREALKKHSAISG